MHFHLNLFYRFQCYREVKHGMYGDLGVMQGSNKWPSYPPSFKQAMEEYIDSCTCALLCRLHTPLTFFQ
ncbi:hypothetical protein P3S67_007060 [Capsicum chacoense]